MTDSPLIATLKNCQVIDLTHTFDKDIPHAPDMPVASLDLIFDFDADGFQAHRYTLPGQWGTHIDPPIHFVRNGRTLDQIGAIDLILPLCVFDVEEECRRNSDYLLKVEDVEQWEKVNGRVESGSFVAMKSGWSSRWPDKEKMFNRDESGTAHFPGWSSEVAEFLISERNVKAFGHEVTDTDGGVAISGDDFSCETLILKRDRYQIELMASMDEVPPTGSVIFVGAPKPKGGSGFTCRILALVPNG